jgi:hypothetical protein
MVIGLCTTATPPASPADSPADSPLATLAVSLSPSLSSADGAAGAEGAAGIAPSRFGMFTGSSAPAHIPFASICSAMELTISSSLDMDAAVDSL